MGEKHTTPEKAQNPSKAETRESTDYKQCDVCRTKKSLIRKTENNLQQHSHHGTETEVHICRECGYRFEQERFGQLRKGNEDTTVKSETETVPEEYTLIVKEDEYERVGVGKNEKESMQKVIDDAVARNEVLLIFTPGQKIDYINKDTEPAIRADGINNELENNL